MIGFGLCWPSRGGCGLNKRRRRRDHRPARLSPRPRRLGLAKSGARLKHRGRTGGACQSPTDVTSPRHPRARARAALEPPVCREALEGVVAQVEQDVAIPPSAIRAESASRWRSRKSSLRTSS
jgi:hypothetical protein